jgi:hypothetical protein
MFAVLGAGSVLMVAGFGARAVFCYFWKAFRATA